MSNIVPYRTLAEIEKYEDEIEVVEKRFGFLKGKPPGKHRCTLPIPHSPISRFFRKLLGKPSLVIVNYDLWRCEECEKVYIYRRWKPGGSNVDVPRAYHVKECIHGCSSFCSYWMEANISHWLDAGGVE